MINAGIYIHIPHCNKGCKSCEFQYYQKKYSIDSIIKLIIKEINSSNTNVSKWNFKTVYFGGCSPNSISSKHIERLLDTINKKFNLNNIKEISISIDPGQYSYSKLKLYYKLGINRLSINGQSFNNKLLNVLGLKYKSSTILNMISDLKTIGYENINVDLLYNIPKQKIKDWYLDIECCVENQIDHISLYRYSLTTNQDNLDNNFWLKHSDKLLSLNNYYHYEIHSFCKNKKEHAHNLSYWNFNPYISFGPSAHSFDGINRWNNYNDITKYMKNKDKDILTVEKYEKNSKLELFNQKIAVGLQKTEGIIIPNTNLKSNFIKNLSMTKNKWDGYLILEKDNIRLSNKGFHYIDQIIKDIVL